MDDFSWSANGNPYQEIPLSDTDPPIRAYTIDGAVYSFAFWSLGFTCEGRRGSVSLEAPDASFEIPGTGEETWTVTAMAWFVWNPNGGEGDGGAAVAELDAFDSTGQRWIGDYFIDVSPDATLDLPANDGEINTSAIATNEILTAENPLARGFLAFDRWLQVPGLTSPADGQPGTPRVDGNALTLHPNNKIYAIALYNEVPLSKAHPVVHGPILSLALTDEGWTLVPRRTDRAAACRMGQSMRNLRSRPGCWRPGKRPSETRGPASWTWLPKRRRLPLPRSGRKSQMRPGLSEARRPRRVDTREASPSAAPQVQIP